MALIDFKDAQRRTTRVIKLDFVCFKCRKPFSDYEMGEAIHRLGLGLFATRLRRPKEVVLPSGKRLVQMTDLVCAECNHPRHRLFGR